MYEPRETTQDDAWAQTLITVTPEEDAVLREITDTALLSARSDTPLDLGTDDVVQRRPLTYQQFINHDKEVENVDEISTKDAENQTYLQGIPIVEIPIEHKDEASQTVYMSAPCPTLKYYKDIMTSMNDVPMPAIKESKIVGTIITFSAETPQDVVTRELSSDITHEKLKEFVAQIAENKESEINVTDILNFILTRVFWVSDPTSIFELQTSHKETQTSIKLNHRTNTILIDNETQTGLTCEPRQSNTKLLSDYQETKRMILQCLEDCFTRSIEPRIIVDNIVEEIIERCAELVRYPTKDQIAQTITSYRLHEEREEDVLRKLKLDVVVDPSEASIIVIPLIDDLLQIVYDDVHKNAPLVVKDILQIILQRTATILVRLVEIRKESQPKPMDQIFDQRRKKILESMVKKETETISTQTGIAGVPEITRLTEPKEVVCSVCRRHSMCHWCLANQEDGDVKPEEIKMMRTQDILLAYTPCYIVATPSENEKNPNLQPTCPPQEKIKPLPAPLVYTSETSSEGSKETINVILKSGRRMKAEESIGGWSRIIDTALSKPWSGGGSVGSKTTIGSFEKSSYKSPKSQSGLASEAAKALQILKSTFCTQGTCTASSKDTLRQDFLSDYGDSEYITSACDICSMSSNVTLTNQNNFIQKSFKPIAKICPLIDEQCLQINPCTGNANCQTDVKLADDGFKIIPICLQYDSDS